MPQADMKYSADLDIDAPAILQVIEKTIAGLDSGAGVCKGRAYPAPEFHHTHVHISIALLNKPHRDAAFMDHLAQLLDAAIKPHLTQPCAYALSLDYISQAHIARDHQP